MARALEGNVVRGTNTSFLGHGGRKSPFSEDGSPSTTNNHTKNKNEDDDNLPEMQPRSLIAMMSNIGAHLMSSVRGLQTGNSSSSINNDSGGSKFLHPAIKIPSFRNNAVAPAPSENIDGTAAASNKNNTDSGKGGLLGFFTGDSSTPSTKAKKVASPYYELTMG